METQYIHNESYRKKAVAISVLIPTRNEATNIAALITYLRALPFSDGAEIIVCDGGSEDATRQIAERAGARVLPCPPNRGAQLNAGARAAGGEVLWFLHADARPHRQSLAHLQRVARRRNACGGNFRLNFDASGFAPRAFEIIARLQRKRGVYYGDSGIWATREVFENLGGFREWPLFEDYDFASRLEAFARAHGRRTEYSRLAIQASSRRFKHAPMGVLLQWARLQFLFSRGVSPEYLAAMYFGSR
jgi:rSAM/selenodomain-associated transferase 2